MGVDIDGADVTLDFVGNTLTLSASWRGGVDQTSVFTRANL
jgi:hypothetical protein